MNYVWASTVVLLEIDLVLLAVLLVLLIKKHWRS